MRALVRLSCAAAILAVGASACLDLDIKDGVVPCAAGGACPTPYHCNAADNRCYRGPAGDGGGPTDGGASDAPACPDANFDTDGSNCSRCGHTCLGGACEQGLCQPAVVGAIARGVDLIAVNGSTLFIGGRAGADQLIPIYTVPKLSVSGVPASLTTVDGSNGNGLDTFLQNMAADDTVLIWQTERDTQTGSMATAYSCTLADCTTSQRTLFSESPNAIVGVDVDSEKLFFQSSGQTAMQVSTLAAPAPQHFSPELNMATVRGLAAARGYIYVAGIEPTCSGAATYDNVLERVPETGGVPVRLANRGNDPGNAVGAPIVVANNAVFVLGSVVDGSGNGGLRMFRVPLPNGQGDAPPQLLANGTPLGSSSYFADDAAVYWIDTNLQLVTCPNAGCPGAPPVLATVGDARGLIGDASALYWYVTLTDPNDPTAKMTTIYRLAR